MRKMGKLVRRLLLLMLIAAMASAAYMYLAPLLRPQEVTVYEAYTVTRGDIATENSFSASISIASSEKHSNTSRATAIREIYVTNGQTVKKGDKLMMLDNGEVLKAGLDGVVTEMRFDTSDWLWNNVDLIQIGARNMQNYDLLRELGRVNKPILLKRGLSSTLEELLMSAEYIMQEGNPNIILCERGIRTFETATRNTLDLSAVPALHQLSHLPVVVDPSHATGKSRLVRPMALAAVASGADGIMVEVHNNPSCALCDGMQSLTPEQFRELNLQVQKIREVLR